VASARADRHQRIRADLRAGRVAQAERHARLATERDAGDSEGLHLLGLAALMRGDCEAGASHFRRAIALRDDVAAYHCNLGEALRRQGDLESAAQSCRRAIAIKGDYVEAHANLGACLVGLHRLEQAHGSLQRALFLHPDDPSLIVRMADCLQQLGRAQEAHAAYRRALELDPRLAVGHAHLGALLLALGLPEQALEHCRQAVALGPESGIAHANLGRCLVALEQIDEAMDAYADARERLPQSAPLCCSIGEVWQEVGELQEAELWFERALEHDPDRLETRLGLADVWRRQSRLDEALAAYRHILDQAPRMFLAHLGFAQALWDDGDAEGAVASYRHAASLQPELAFVHAAAGQVLTSAGDIEGGTAAFRRALAQQPECIAALSGLATTLRARIDPCEVTRMQGLLGAPALKDGDRAGLHAGLAQYYDGIGATAEAADHADRANRFYWAHKSRRGWRYEQASHEQEVDHLIDTFGPTLFERTAGFGLDSTMPVFVVGMPRSGTTLIEQILASHPAVFGAGERTFAGRGLARVAGAVPEEQPWSFRGLQDRDAVREVERWHLAELDRLRQRSKAGASRVVDKMPDNYLMLGWIAIMFPNVRVIHCRRDLRDIALSCWMVQFRDIRWACHPGDIAHRILQHQRVMAHWRAALPLQIYDLCYESLVSAPEIEIRRLLAWLGLAWHPSCLAFHRSERLVRTASVTQVREPIHRRAVERWRRYEPFLGALFDPLSAAAKS